MSFMNPRDPRHAALWRALAVLCVACSLAGFVAVGQACVWRLGGVVYAACPRLVDAVLVGGTGLTATAFVALACLVFTYEDLP